MIHLLMAVLAVSQPPGMARLDYRAPEGCPTDVEFRAAVAARGGDLSAGTPVENTAILVVSIHRQVTGFAGSFQRRDQEHVTGKRQLAAASCAEVADALALVTAIEARGGEQAADPAVSVAPAASPPADVSPPVQPPAPPTSAPAPDDRLRGSTRAFPSRTETVPVKAGELRFDLSRPVAVAAGATIGLVPSTWLPTYRLQTTLASFVTTPEGSARIVGPVFGFYLDYLGGGTYSSADTSTVVHGVAFGFDVCQAPFYDTRGFTALICGELGGGLLKLDTKNMAGAAIQAKSAGFGTASGVIDLRYNLFAGLFVNARVSGGFTLGDITAERADGSRIFGSGHWSASGTLGVGWPF